MGFMWIYVPGYEVKVSGSSVRSSTFGGQGLGVGFLI